MPTRNKPARPTGFTRPPHFRYGPRADESCSLTRVIERDGVRLHVWTCTAPKPAFAPNGLTLRAFRFPDEHARENWPGCSAAWYDAWPWDFPLADNVIPGRTQYVVFDGGAGGDPHQEP